MKIYIKRIDIAIFVIFVAYFSFLWFFKYNRYLAFTPSLDYHAYLQMFWNTAEGRLLEYNGLKAEIRMMFQYHFAIILIPIAWLYMLFNHQLTGYFIYTLIIASSVLPLYFLAKTILKNSIAAYLLVGIFILYPPVLNADLAGFAEESLAIPFCLAALYFIFQGKKSLVVIFSALLLYLRINLTAIVFSLGLLFFTKGKKFIGVAIMLLSLLWLALIIFIVNPFYPTPDTPGTQYIWWFFKDYGTNPSEIIWNILTNPSLVQKIVFTSNKLVYFKDLFEPLGFLPLLSLFTYLGLPIYVLSLLSNNGLLSSVYMHHHATLIPFIFLGLIGTTLSFQRVFEYLQKRYRLSFKSEYISVILLFLLLIHIANYNRTALPARYLFFSPYYNKVFYSISNRDRANAKIVEHIPSNFSLAMDEMYMEHLAERKWYWDTGNFAKFNPDLVLLDFMNFPKNDAMVKEHKDYSEVYSNYTSKLYARNNLVETYPINNDFDLDVNKNYIIRAVPFATNIVPLSVISLEEPMRPAPIYGNKKYAQLLTVNSPMINKLSLIGYKTGFPKGELIIELRDDSLKETYLSRVINFHDISWEPDIFEIPLNDLDLKPAKNYALVIYLSEGGNLEANSFSVMTYATAYTDYYGTLLEDPSGKEDWRSVAYKFITQAYYDMPDQLEDKDITVLQDGSILLSGNGSDLQAKIESIRNRYKDRYSLFILISN